MSVKKRIVEYNRDVHLRLIKWMVRSGQVDRDIALELGIAIRTFYDWRRRYPEIQRVMQRNRFWVDHLVEDSLLKRALGFKTKEVITIRKPLTRTVREAQGENPAETVTEQVVVEQRVVRKRVAPDVTACMFWLRNRQPDQWKEVLRNEFTGKDEEIKKVKAATSKVLRDPETVRIASDLARRVAVNPGGPG